MQGAGSFIESASVLLFMNLSYYMEKEGWKN